MNDKYDKNTYLKKKSDWEKVIIHISWAFFFAFVCFLIYNFFNGPIFSVTSSNEKDISYIIEDHKAVLNLELVRRTVTGVIDKLDRKDYSLKIWGLDEKTYTLNSYAEIKCPVTFSYYVSLDDPWKITVKNGVVRVLAPKIKAGNIQIDTSRIKERYEASVIGFEKEEILSELRKSMTPLFKQMAEQQKHISYVREDCRKQISKFISNWLLNKEEIEAVIVSFEDDKDDENIEVITRNESYLEFRNSY